MALNHPIHPQPVTHAQVFQHPEQNFPDLPPLPANATERETRAWNRKHERMWNKREELYYSIIQGPPKSPTPEPEPVPAPAPAPKKIIIKLIVKRSMSPPHAPVPAKKKESKNGRKTKAEKSRNRKGQGKNAARVAEFYPNPEIKTRKVITRSQTRKLKLVEQER